MSVGKTSPPSGTRFVVVAVTLPPVDPDCVVAWRSFRLCRLMREPAGSALVPTL